MQDITFVKVTRKNTAAIDKLVKAVRATFGTKDAIQLKASDFKGLYPTVSSQLNKTFNLGIRTKQLSGGRVNVWAEKKITRNRPFGAGRKAAKSVDVF